MPGAVAPGIWAIAANRPAGGDPSKFYAIEAADGFVLVDAGWGTGQALTALTSALAEAGGGLDDVRGIVLTHMHVDHCGLAEQLRERTGAWVAATAEEVAAAKHRHGTSAAHVNEVARFLQRAGVPEDAGEPMVEWRRQMSGAAPIFDPDRALADGDLLELGSRTLVALSTPGHSPGHLCFHDDDNGVLFAGDTVLPKRNPPIGSYAPDGQHDPISDFFDSLDRIAQLDGCLVLPGHGDPFTGPARDVARLRAHHEKRMGALSQSLARGPATVWESAVSAPWSRPWQDLSPMAQLLALAKVNAHLTALVRRGVVKQVDGDVVRYALVDQPAELAPA